MNVQQVTANSSVPEVTAAIIRLVRRQGRLELETRDKQAIPSMLNGIAQASRKLTDEGIELRIAPVVARVDAEGFTINAIRLFADTQNDWAGSPSSAAPAGNDTTPAQISEDFAERQEMATDSDRLLEMLLQHTSESPVLSGGDVDAAWYASDVGQETVGGSSPTPDQDIVELLGEAVGVTYDDDEPLRTAEKLAERDEDRWLLDPESAKSELDHDA